MNRKLRDFLSLPTDKILKLIEEENPGLDPLFYLSVLNRVRRENGMNPITSLSRAMASPTNGRKGGRPRKHHSVRLTPSQLILLRVILEDKIEYAASPAPILTETLAVLNAS